MKIYTRTGDTGETGLLDGRRVSKAAPRVDAYGEVGIFDMQTLLVNAVVAVGLLGGATALVDVLMVVLIFLVVSTTFKESQAYIELAASENPEGQLNSDKQPLLVTIPRATDHVLIRDEEIPLDKLG